MKAAIAELERHVAEIDEARARLDQRRDNVVSALNDLRELQGEEGGKPPAARGLKVVRGKKAPAKPPRAPKVAPVKKRGRLSDTVIANARTIAERDGLPAGVQRTGIPYGTLYTYAKKGKWKLPDTRGRRVAQKPAAAAPAKRRTVGTECPKCHTISPENPCSTCGTAKKVPA